MIDEKERQIRDRIASYLLCKAFDLRFTPELARPLREAAVVLQGPATLDEVIIEGDDRSCDAFQEGKRETVEFAVAELEELIRKLKDQ